MATISKIKKGSLPLPRNSQLKYALFYVLITSVVLMFLNFYAAATTRELIFQSKQVSLEDKAEMTASAFSGIDILNRTNVNTIMRQLGNLNATRVMVTDQAGYVLYDSLEGGRQVGKLALLPEIVQALGGDDVFYCRYAGGVLESREAMPIMYYNLLIGSVYLMEYDTSGGGLIDSLQQNLLTISVALELIVVFFSCGFARAFSRRMRRILESVHVIREGDYSHKIMLRGRDELALLGEEFNDLTDRLQESESRRRQFVADASHELKTPLASIKLLSDSILQNDMDQETIREFVGDIGSEADRLTRMSQKLLSLNKMDAGARDDMEIADIGETAARVLRMLEPVAAVDRVTLENKTWTGGTILIMEDDLYQIVFNLVENAIKYNRPGGSVTLRLMRREEELILTVEDTGVGIPEDAMPHIFDRFYRVDKARSRQAGGSGLGLSIVHDMVGRNYGSIRVESRTEGGTRFIVTFPAFDVEKERGEEEEP